MLDSSTVLIVADDVTNLIALTDLLSRYKVVSDKAIDGFEAIDKVKKRHQMLGDSFKLILMDYSMPHFNGL